MNENRSPEDQSLRGELDLQNEQKERLWAELNKANKELLEQLGEKEKRTAELALANKELSYQDIEKKKREEELSVLKEQLAFQISEKKKSEADLVLAKKELLVFTFISSHHLQEPIRKIQIFADRVLVIEEKRISEKGKVYFKKMRLSARKVRQLLEDLTEYSNISNTPKEYKLIDLDPLVGKIKSRLHRNRQT